MTYKEKLCGIYVISTPNGSKYVGSSRNIYRRWSEHRGHLRRGTHHSERLQMAWEKHEGKLIFEIYQLCNVDELVSKEQKAIDELKAELNTTNYVHNVWANPETREKLQRRYSSEQWKRDRSNIAKALAKRRGVSVDCSDGRSFVNFHEAAKAFGIYPSGIRALVKTQRAGKLGVKFKKSCDPWWDVVSAAEQRMATMVKNNTLKRSDEARKRMSDSAKKRSRSSTKLKAKETA